MCWGGGGAFLTNRGDDCKGTTWVLATNSDFLIPIMFLKFPTMNSVRSNSLSLTYQSFEIFLRVYISNFLQTERATYNLFTEEGVNSFLI